MNHIEHISIVKTTQDDYLYTWLEAFQIDRKISGFAPGTLVFYKTTLKKFSEFCEARAISRVSQITTNDIRIYLMDLENAGHNAGGRHSYYRAVKTFLRWYEEEAEPEGWKNPIKKVKAPKLTIQPIQGVSMPDFGALQAAAAGTTQSERDQAILLALLDTGARAAEFVAMSLSNVNLITGAILIPKGKGSKPRTVFIGKKSRKAIRGYLRTRTDESGALWVTDEGERLTQAGMRQVIKRLAAKAGIPEPSAHDFRRAFALNMLRSGCDVFTLARLMGHASIQVLQRYLAQDATDTENAHRLYGFVDKM